MNDLHLATFISVLCETCFHIISLSSQAIFMVFLLNSHESHSVPTVDIPFLVYKDLVPHGLFPSISWYKGS